MHSAPATLTPDSESQAERPGIQPEPPQQDGGRPTWLRGWMVIAAVVVVLGTVLLIVATRSKTPAVANRGAVFLEHSWTNPAAQGNNRGGAVPRHPGSSAGGTASGHAHHHPDGAGGNEDQEGRSAGRVRPPGADAGLRRQAGGIRASWSIRSQRSRPRKMRRAPRMRPN